MQRPSIRGLIAALILFPATVVAQAPVSQPDGVGAGNTAYHLLYEVDVQNYVRDEMEDLVPEVAQALAMDPAIPYAELATDGEAVSVRILDPTQLDAAIGRLSPLAPPNSPAADDVRWDLEQLPEGRLQLAYSDASLTLLTAALVKHTISILGHRLQEAGIDPNLQPDLANGIRVTLPNPSDSPVDLEQVKQLVGQQAKVSMHVVHDRLPPGAALPAETADTRLIPAGNPSDGTYLVGFEALITGDDIVDADAAVDPMTDAPVVSFRFNAAGAASFGAVTAANIGRVIAIVVDGVVVTAPVVMEAILGGSGLISGTLPGEAESLAIQLRAGALPAALRLVEEGVGP